jgi:hypothetical protein
MQVLKFVLWTWPSAGADNAGFQNDRIKFHQILAHTKVHGFLGSGIFKVDTAPFAGSFLFENSHGLAGIRRSWRSGTCSMDPLPWTPSMKP